MKRRTGAIRLGAAFALLFTSLSLVVWRQSRALEELRGLDEARSTRAVLQAERSELQREIQSLESRSRIIVAGARLKLRVPSAAEIVILRAPDQPAAVDVGPAPARRNLLTNAERS